MKLSSIWSVLLSAGTAVSAAPSNHFTRYANSTVSKQKVIIDNDWSTNGFIPILQAIKAGWDVVGVLSDTANSWALQCGLHALATLEVGDLGCIPVYRGADYPILNRPGLLQSWEDVHGVLAWEGAFAPENATAEENGFDVTSGNPDRIAKSAFKEGYPNITFASDISAAEFLVQQVRKYPGEISIWSGGALTNIALAARIDPNFAKNAKELVIMGGYLDANLLQTTGTVLLADLQSDINLMIDPEGTKMALTADFPNITICGNVANQVMTTQDFLDELIEVENPYSRLYHDYADTSFPFWDETAMAVMLDPSIVKNSTKFYLDVDTSYASPSYGNIHAHQRALAPRVQPLQEVNFILEIDGDVLLKQIKEAVQYPPICSTGW
ncbi:putative inosine/uridine-preferring nucleoside hydrolase domain, ribonucleoside hydrolase [Septoria linicola]|nr:putative inosine/uridine-preferring nucleoside hydrolase domain, ribonucleoside hydrolase [Septoria linicola]